LFHALGNSYEQRATEDAGRHMNGMATGMGNLGSLLPSLAGQPPPFDGPQPAIETAAKDILGGAALAALTVARTAVSRHWSDAIAAASADMQASLKKLTDLINPSWKENLPPSTWQVLVDSVGDVLGNIDGEAIMTRFNQAKKARSGISHAPALSPQPSAAAAPTCQTHCFNSTG
jgi:hypothetical protein